MIALQIHTDSSEALYKRSLAITKRFAQGIAEESPAISDALLGDNGRRVQGIATRHLPSMSRGVRRIVEEMGHTADSSMCPLLAAEGISPADAQMMRVKNGREQGAEMRATSYRCPVCLAADVVRTLRRDGDAARNAEQRWNRIGS